MKQNESPRKFTLGYLSGDKNDGCDYFVVTHAEPKVSFDDVVKGDIKVIELSAYEDLEKKLAKAIETLEFCDGHLKFMDNYSLISGALFHIRDTLKQIKEPKDGSDTKVQST